MNRQERNSRGFRSRRGLTLLEVMVVVLILGMVAGIVSKVVVDRVEQARVETAKIQMREFRDALEFFYQDHHFYPSTQQGLEALVERPDDERIDDWPEHGYLRAIPDDPWGNPYRYVSPGAHEEYDIICLGRDGEPGGEGFDADIKSWELAGGQ
jgi:general secretion pathway protein G